MTNSILRFYFLLYIIRQFQKYNLHNINDLCKQYMKFIAYSRRLGRQYIYQRENVTLGERKKF